MTKYVPVHCMRAYSKTFQPVKVLLWSMKVIWFWNGMRTRKLWQYF